MRTRKEEPYQPQPFAKGIKKAFFRRHFLTMQGNGSGLSIFMSRISMAFTVSLLALFCFQLMNCAQSSKQKDHSLVQTTGIAPEDFPKEIARLSATTKRQEDKALRAEAHLRLSLLHSHYLNPSVDYGKALLDLERYMALEPQKSRTDEIQNRLALLRELRKLFEANREMNKQLEVIKAENERLKEVIEKLNRLDMELEEKRKGIK